MKELYESNKKLGIAVITILCIIILSVTCVAAIHIAETAKEKEVSVSESVSADDVRKEKQYKSDSRAKSDKSNDKTVVKESEDLRTADDVTSEAAEVVEDSELDVVETPSPNEEKTAEESSEPEDNPNVDLSNMAQNAKFPFEIRVNKLKNCVTVYAMDKSGVYSIPYKAFVCSTGYATPLGTYKTPAKYIWKVLKGNVWGQFSTRITGSILFHSVPYRTNNKNDLIADYYNDLGSTASAGCIRLTTIDAKWIYDNCPLGTTVIIYNDTNPGPLGKPTAMKLPLDSGWDPTDPDPANPWIGHTIRIDGVGNRIVERGSNFDAMAGVTASDTSGNNITGNIVVSTDMDISRTGTYGIHYTVRDSYGNSLSEEAAVTVVDTQAPVINGVASRIEGKSVAEINRDFLLKGISVTDNGYGLSIDHVDVNIPSLVDGDNKITFTAKDDYGNQSTASTIVVCDMTAPVISRASNATSYVECDWRLTDSNIKSRISVSDKSPTNISYSVNNLEWGYEFNYTVVDSYGNTSNFTDTVSYIQYELIGAKSISVIENGDMSNGIQLRDNTGKVIDLPSDAEIYVSRIDSSSFNVHVIYTYSTELGTKTCTFDRIAYIMQ